MNEVNRSIFSGMQVLLNERLEQNQAVVVEDHCIKAIIPIDMISHHLPAKRYEFSADHCLVPGFIDLHLHGTHGHDVMDASGEALAAISRALAADGVTGYLATTMTAENRQLEQVLKTIASARDLAGAALLGVHLEGPFIAKAKMGAQDGRHVQLPDVDVMRHWQKLAKGAIKIVTLAPEVMGAIPFIHALKEMGVIASVGHTHANFDETTQAIAAGCTHATHLFNAMTGLHQRDPGAVGALLLAKTVCAELIVDGMHLHPGIVDLSFQLKQKEGIVLVTDAMRATCLGAGQYTLGGQAVYVQHGRATLASGVLAGSTLRMPMAIQNMMQFTGCTLGEAIFMASTNPARVLKLGDRKGSIAVGKDADLVVLDADYNVRMTMREGREVYASMAHA